jgi:hypothetical protein
MQIGSHGMGNSLIPGVSAEELGCLSLFSKGILMLFGQRAFKVMKNQ